jgi:hypothetical protein
MLELMTVVTIIAVAAILVVPDYIRSGARKQLKQSAIELETLLNMSRMLAMNRNTTVTMTLATVGGRVQAQSGGVLPNYTMPQEIIAFGGMNPVRFNSYGMVVGITANQQVTLTNNRGLVYSLQVTPGGRVRWCASATCP